MGKDVGVAVQGINLKTLKVYVNQTIEFSIQDHTGEEQPAPFVKKQVKKVELCPDQTHVRLYFDPRNFWAIPLSSDVAVSDKGWVAFDDVSKLYYVIREVD
jgi:uncharacterized protein YprB with RNaseH-like and TPR domain